MNVFVNKHSYDITAKHFRPGYFHHNTPVTNKKYRTIKCLKSHETLFRMSNK